MEFLSLSRRRSSARNVPSGEERGETDVFAGYAIAKEKVLHFLCFEVSFITRKMKDTRINGPEENKTNKREILPLMQHPRNLVGGKELLIYLFSLAHRESGEGSDLEGLVKSGMKSIVTRRDVLFDPYISVHLRKLLVSLFGYRDQLTQ